MVNEAQLGRGRRMEQAQVLKPRITLIDGRVMTTSIVVAQHFCKQHKDVLRTIDHAVEQMPPISTSAILRSFPTATPRLRIDGCTA